MSNRIADVLEKHHYPAGLMRRPRRIWIHYAVLRFLHLRSRICLSALQHQLSLLPPDAKILDVGCGEGQFLIPSAKRFPDLHFSGIDIFREHIHFLQRLSEEEKLSNVQLLEGDIETDLLPAVPVRLIYIFSVLQYLKNPEKVLERFGRIQSPGGICMLYTPLEPRFKFRFLEYLRHRYPHYDSVRETFQPVSEQDLHVRVVRAGYEILDKKYYYSRTAAFGHALLQSLMILAGHWPRGTKWLPALFFIVMSPIFVSLQMVDTVRQPKTGNSILMILEKRKSSGRKQ